MKGASNPNYRGGPIELPCRQCGRIVPVVRARAHLFKYCSRACRAEADRAKRGPESPLWKGGHKAAKRRYLDKQTKARPLPGAMRFCPACGKAHVPKGRKFHPECSPLRFPKRVTVRCLDCGQERIAFPKPDRSLPVRCLACDRKSRNGHGNANWKGGITPFNKKLRASEHYRQWRTAVFERDGYTCVWCGQRGGKLNADHIKPFSTHPALRFEISNGRTLCVDCHKRTDTYLSKAKKRAITHG